MGDHLKHFQHKKKTIKRLAELFDRQDNVLVIHYSCESFYDIVDGRTPRITSLALRNLESAQTHSFSIHKVAEQNHISVADISSNYDSLELTMLAEFFEFVKSHQNYIWLHWNMRDINYGFQAIEHRYRVLGGDPIEISDAQKVDLARALVSIYGIKYAGHPRLENLIELNKISKRDYLIGAQEATAFVNKEFVKLHQSTLRKVDILANIASRVFDDSLTTNTGWIGRHWIHPAVYVEFILEHWIYGLFAIIALLYSLKDFWLKIYNIFYK